MSCSARGETRGSGAVREGTPRWLLGGGRSLTHPGAGIILLYQLVLTKAPALAPLRPVWASLSAPVARSRRGLGLLKALWAPRQHPASGRGPGGCSGIPALNRSLDISPRPDTAACTSAHPSIPPTPLFHSSGKLGGGCRILPASAQTTRKQAELLPPTHTHPPPKNRSPRAAHGPHKLPPFTRNQTYSPPLPKKRLRIDFPRI